MESSCKHLESDPRINWWLWNIVTATTVGFVLRVYRLDTQFPTLDEWHTITVAVNHDFFEILTSFFSGGHSIPVALYYRILAKVTGITETGIYAPFVLTGTASIGLVPFLLRDMLGKRTSALLAWCIALAPIFLFYSRFARPYGIVATLSIVAIWSFVKWDDTRSSRYLVGYGIAASFSAYFHVIALPFVVTPIAAILFRDIVLMHSSVAKSLKNSALAGLAVGTPTIVLLGVPAWNSYGAVTEKMEHGALTTHSMFEGYLVLVGSKELPVTIVITGLALIGTWALIRNKRSRLLATLLLGCSAAQVATVVGSQPLAIEGPHIFARYVIPVMFPLLIFTAAGFGYAAKRLPRFPTVGIAAVMLVVYFANTSSWILTKYNSETNLYILGYLIFGKPFERFPLDNVRHKIPAFYEMLSRKSPGEIMIVEAPFHIDDYFLVSYQLLHRQRVLMGITEPLCGTEIEWQKQDFRTYGRTHIKNIVDISDPVALAAKGVTYVVLHRSIHAETAALEAGFIDINVTRCIDFYLNNYGPAVFDDGEVIAFAINERKRQIGD